MTQKILTRDFILVFLAQIVFTSVFYILIPTFPIYLSKLGFTETETGVLIGIFFFSSVVFRPFVGRRLSKVPEKDFMIAGAILFAIASSAYLMTSFFWFLLLARLLQGIGFAFFHTAAFTLIANISPEARRGQSLSYFYMAFNFSGALAPPIGMALINHFGFALLFLVCLGLSLCSLLITYKFARRQVTPLQHSPAEDGFILSRKAIPPSIVNFFSFFIWGALGAFFPLYAIKHGVSNPGFFFTTIAIMLILGRTLGGKILDLHSRESIILPCLVTYILSMFILAFSKTLPMFILVAVIWAIGHAFSGPTLVAYSLERVGSSPGTVMGTFSAITDLGASLGPVIMGIVIRSTSYSIMFLCLALTGFINLNYFYFFVREKKGGEPLET